MDFEKDTLHGYDTRGEYFFRKGLNYFKEDIMKGESYLTNDEYNLKFQNSLQKDVFDYFYALKDFHFHGRASTFFFRTWEKGKEKHQIKSKNPTGIRTQFPLV